MYPLGFEFEGQSCFCCEPKHVTATVQGCLSPSTTSYQSSAISNIPSTPCGSFNGPSSVLSSQGSPFTSPSFMSSFSMTPSPGVDTAVFQSDAGNINNLRYLQNRQLGMMMPGKLVHAGGGDMITGENTSSAQPLSASAPIASSNFGTAEGDVNDLCPMLSGIALRSGRRLSDVQLTGRRIPGEQNSRNSMNLDSALDELGMLSTVTNSRREFLLEQQRKPELGWLGRENRLRSKSESSPNLSALGRQASREEAYKGYHILRINHDFVTGFSNTAGCRPSGNSSGSSSSNNIDINYGASNFPSPLVSPMARNYRSPDLLEDSARRRRSVPRMSRFRKDRYRKSRCPYSIPNRLSTSLQECDFDFTYPRQPSQAEEELVDHLATSLRLSAPAAPSTPPSGYLPSQSKSTSSSPVKLGTIEGRLPRSLSAENLDLTRREPLEVTRGTSMERGLDLMTSQLTHLHMT